jgi:CIC family chloride channel protein
MSFSRDYTSVPVISRDLFCNTMVSKPKPILEADGSADQIDDDVPQIGLVRLSILALVVGVVTGFGAIVFRDLIGFIHNAFFLGQFSVRYDANHFTPPSPWGAMVILVPVVGALVVTFLITKFAPEARGHGVPEVMDAIYYGGGVIRPIVAVVKSLASAIAIGTGAAV